MNPQAITPTTPTDPLAPFATIEDLSVFYKPLTDADEIARAQMLLEFASDNLRMIARNNGMDIDAQIAADTTGLFAKIVKNVILTSVKRALNTPADMPTDATMWSQSATPYSEQVQFVNPTSDIFFKNNELKILGLSSINGNSQFGVLRMEPEQKGGWNNA